MTAKHTPASWVCEGSTQNGDFAIYNEKTFEEVLDIHTGTIHEKNLSLILAAPEMYEILSEIANELGVFSGLCDNPLTDDGREKIEALLAKARGEI